MKILFINKYFYPKGGPERVVFDTAGLFQDRGHTVTFFSMRHPKNHDTPCKRFFVSQVDYEKPGLINAVRSSLRMFYSCEANKKLRLLIKKNKPDVAHLHNIYHQISPSILHCLKENNVPVVMTLHDFKMVCASYLMLNKGKICEACKKSKYYRAFLKGCVRGSRIKSIPFTLEMYLHHKIMKIYDLVDVFITPGEFFRSKLQDMGFRGNFVHLANFVDVDKFKPLFRWQENSIIYFGRIAKEKGLFTLVDAVKNIKEVFLKIAGEGPAKNELQEKIKKENIKNVVFLGYMQGLTLHEEIGKSMFVVLPSECYENNPLQVLESFALGKPVIGSKIGGIPELIIEDKTGNLFTPYDAHDLRFKIEHLIANPARIMEMGINARVLAEKELNAQQYYDRLLKIYESVVGKTRIGAAI